MDMRRRNRHAEYEAIEILDPPPNSRVLVVGCGPGVGVGALAARVTSGHVVAVDPSKVMCNLTSKRCADELATGHVTVVRGTIHDVVDRLEPFGGAIAVNALQLCDPFSGTAVSLGRLLTPGSELVSLTHDWAMKKHFGTVDDAIQSWTDALEQAGFSEFASYPARSENGRSIVFRCVRIPPQTS